MACKDNHRDLAECLYFTSKTDNNKIFDINSVINKVGNKLSKEMIDWLNMMNKNNKLNFELACMNGDKN